MARTITGTLKGPDGTTVAGKLRLTAKSSTPGATGIPKGTYFDMALAAGVYNDDIELGTYYVDLYEAGKEMIRLGEAAIDDGASSDILTLISASESPITTTLAIANGGTGSTTAAGAASNLGLGTEDSPTFTALVLSGTAPSVTLTDTDTGADNEIDGSVANGSVRISADANDEVANSALYLSVDGNDKLWVFDDDTAQFYGNTNDFFLSLGLGATARGRIALRGGPTGQDDGGTLYFYTADDHNATTNYWYIRANEDDLQFGNDDTAQEFKIAPDGGIHAPNIKTGTTQVGAGAVAGELWADTDDGYAIKLGT